MLPSETQSRGRVQQMRQHRSLDKHDRPKGDALMQRQDQDAVREKILKRPGTSTARSPMAPTLWNSGRQRAKCWRSRSQEPDDGVLHRSNWADRVKAVAARSVGARSASLDAGRSMGNPPSQQHSCSFDHLVGDEPGDRVGWVLDRRSGQAAAFFGSVTHSEKSHATQSDKK